MSNKKQRLPKNKTNDYQKFGPDGLEYQTDTSKLMAGLGFFYVVWITVAYLLTRRKSVGAAQTWTFTGLLALGIFEYQASIVGLDFAEEFLPQLALFERIELLHRLCAARTSAQVGSVRRHSPARRALLRGCPDAPRARARPARAGTPSTSSARGSSRG